MEKKIDAENLISISELYKEGFGICRIRISEPIQVLLWLISEMLFMIW